MSAPRPRQLSVGEETIHHSVPSPLAQRRPVHGVRDEAIDRAGEGVQVGWIGKQDAQAARSTIWSEIPPTALAITGRRLNIASLTVSPKPSARLFCTTIAAWRWSALTMTAFSSRSAIGRQASDA